jgi:predicted transcriptional regulator
MLVEHAFSASPFGKPTVRGFRLEIRSIDAPTTTDPQAELDWLCQSLGFFGAGAGSKKALRLFREIVEATEKSEPVSSTDLARRLKISRGATIHYLNQFLETGLVVKSGRWYFCRNRSMLETIGQIEMDIERVLAHMKQIAKKIDKGMGVGFGN